ncbi:MAG: hypothetical protein R2705_15160 [Ilumatobacteraceae bacterium]
MSGRVRRAAREPVWAAMNAIAKPTALAGRPRLPRDRRPAVWHDVVDGGPRPTSEPHLCSAHEGRALLRHRLSPRQRGTGPTSTPAYAELVRRRTGHELRAGEASPYYVFHPLALERIAADLPNVKLVLLLRDPVERTISHHKHEVRRGNETLSLTEALAEEDARLAGEDEAIVAGAPNHHSIPTSSGRIRPQPIRRAGRSAPEAVPAGPIPRGPERAALRATPGGAPGLVDFLGVPAWTPDDFPQKNATPVGGVDPAVRAELVDRFRPHNERLYELLGERFDWQE